MGHVHSYGSASPLRVSEGVIHQHWQETSIRRLGRIEYVRTEEYISKRIPGEVIAFEKTDRKVTGNLRWASK